MNAAAGLKPWLKQNSPLLLVIGVKFLILTLTPSIFSDTWYYYDLSQQMIEGSLPYKDFKFEYPPLAIIPIALPGFLLHIFNQLTRDHYITCFRSMLYVSDVLFLFFIHLKFQKDNSKHFFYLSYALLSLPLATLLYDRLDLLFGFLGFASFYTCSKFQGAKAASWALIGIFYKLLSLIFLPFIFWNEILIKKFNFQQYLRWFLLPALIMSAACCWIFEEKIFQFLTYHQSRGIQIESSWASLHALIQFLTQGAIRMEYSHGAQHLKDVSLLISYLANYAVMASLILLFLWYMIKKLPLLEVMMTALLVFLTLGKVLSPQYLIWFLPLLIFFQKSKSEVIMLFLASCLSGFIFTNYGDLMALRAWSWWCLIIRNLILLVWLLVRLKRHWEFKPSFYVPSAYAQSAA